MPRRRFIDNRPTHPFPANRTTDAAVKELVASYPGHQYVAEREDDELKIYRVGGDSADPGLDRGIIPLTAAAKRVRHKAQDAEHQRLFTKVSRQMKDYWQRAQGIRT